MPVRVGAFYRHTRLFVSPLRFGKPLWFPRPCSPPLGSFPGAQVAEEIVGGRLRTLLPPGSPHWFVVGPEMQRVCRHCRPRVPPLLVHTVSPHAGALRHRRLAHHRALLFSKDLVPDTNFAILVSDVP